jgi:hypothetical protein
LGDVHLRVRVPPSSGFAAVPLAVANGHNPRVVACDQRCSGVTFLASEVDGTVDLAMAEI